MSTQSTGSDWQRLHDVALFLSCFRVPQTLEKVTEVIDWKQVLRWEPEEIIEKLMAEDLLQLAEPTEPLAQRLERFTVQALRAMSRKRPVPVSPPKRELIAQLIDRDPQGMERVAFRRTLLQCTEQGAKTVDVYLAQGVQSLPQQQNVPLDKARKVIQWILLAAAGGVIGDTSYNALKALVGKLRVEAPAVRVARSRIEPEMVYVPSGPFLMGTSAQQVRYMRRRFDWAKDWSFARELPQHRVTLRAFEIGRYPITNAEFKRFLDNGGYRNRDYWTDAGWEYIKRSSKKQPAYWDRDESNFPVRPVVGISWYEALACCNWLAAKTGQAYRLPTEAEWEKAARGTDGRLWPWGNNWDPKCCNFLKSGPARTTPVGQYSPRGDSPYGCADMAGNVWEWTRSLYKPYPYDPKDGREKLDHGPRVLRGGSFGNNEWGVRCASRYRRYPNSWYDGIGFRVVVAPGLPLASGNSGL